MTEKQETKIILGQIIRAYREKLGRNQRSVSCAAGISTSMLSQIERGQVSPSLDTVLKLCRTLGVEPADLFRCLSDDTPYVLHRTGERLKLENGGVSFEQLATSSNATYPGELVLLEIEPGSCGTTSAGHEGVEMGYVLAGEACLSINDEHVTLQKGASISYISHLPHKIENTGSETFRAIWNIQPALRDYLELNKK